MPLGQQDTRFFVTCLLGGSDLNGLLVSAFPYLVKLKGRPFICELVPSCFPFFEFHLLQHRGDGKTGCSLKLGLV